MGDREELVAIYVNYVQSIMAIETRRQQTSAVFLTLIGGALAALGVLKSVNHILPVLATFVLAILWHQKLSYFQRLASVKWRVCLDLEEKLSHHPFTDENTIMKQNVPGHRQGKSRLSDIELRVPFFVALCSAVYLAIACFNWLRDLGMV